MLGDISCIKLLYNPRVKKIDDNDDDVQGCTRSSLSEH